MRTLITGGGSLLGKYLIATRPHGYAIETTWYTNYIQDGHQLDIGNKSQVRYVLDKIKPELIIHCAAIGSVDYAETNYSEVLAVNVRGTENLLQAAKVYNAKFVYISSNAIYEGVNPPYSETSPLKPVNAYGRFKVLAEQAVRDSDIDYIIIRPFMLYGWPTACGRGNWATFIIRTLGGNQSLKLVNDVVWQPTYALDCAKTIWQLSGEICETFNVAAPERLTLYQFGLKVAKVWDFDEKLLEAVSSDSFPAMVKRPRDTSYDLRKLNERGIFLPGVIDGLEKMRLENGL